MKVFRVSPSYSGTETIYRGLVAKSTAGVEELWRFDGTPKADRWAATPREVKFVDPEKPIGDFLAFYPSSALAVVNPDRLEITRILLECAELLPLRAPGLRVSLANVVPAEACLDEKASQGKRLADGRLYFVERYEFIRERLPRRSLFKAAEEPYGVFALQGATGEDDDFKRIVERDGLMGLDFTEVWNDDGDPVQVREFGTSW